MRKIVVLLLIFITILMGAILLDMRETTQTSFLLNTISTITVKGNNNDVVDNAFKRVAEIENHMSSHIPTSDLYTGNLSPDTAFVIKKGIEYGDVSNGDFDITIKPICDLWDINGDNPKVPAKNDIDLILPNIDYKKISLDNDVLTLPQGMGIELGAIAKGYAADEACRILREGGIESGIVDLGGNIIALGTKKIGIRNPLSENNGDYFGTIKITDCAVATSGGYERYFEQDGIRYHHIFDPSTGFPVKTNLLSATVVAERAIDADCWSTILFSAGVEKAEGYIDKYGLRAILVQENGQINVYGNLNFQSFEK